MHIGSMPAAVHMGIFPPGVHCSLFCEASQGAAADTLTRLLCVRCV
jgi:hypothetical protein